ncbi:fatty-acyl-CoA synthase [Salinibacillus kushneri]|uniref:Fatty-acyl-CoA synthase n=1 Tax=Salinibacillus kushneri TaxID=237682 RepID=A0A1H9ZAK9_9BACI|nr:AMP-binding protein [Salinibacillus kushneri]SES78585.1 fatty-acyl-CoA synthase [Salinibacillus kushneri]
MSLLELTIGELLEKEAKAHPDREAVVYPERNLRWTYNQLDELANEAAKGFLSLGIEKDENIAIWADNKPEWILSQFASGKMGAVLVTVNTNYQADELDYLLKQSDTTTLILAESYKGTSYIDILHEICPELKDSEKGDLMSSRLPKLKNIIVISEKNYEGCYTWNEVIEKGQSVSDESLLLQKNRLHYDDVINMQYTSGTTGFPKGVMLSHYNIVNNGKQVAERMNLTAEDRLCIPVPLFHCFGCVMGTLASVSQGATMVMVEQFDAETVLRAVDKEKCTALHGVPTMFIAELNHPQFNQYHLSHLRTGIMAGSNCPIEVMRSVMNKMGISEITIAYGQTESSPVITQTKTDDPIEFKVSTVGKAQPNVEVKIVDPATNEEVPPHTSGELCARGYLVMKGYYNNVEATKNTIDKEGWLHTGGIAMMDEEGYVKITGRIKDIVIRGGENIYPREIEEFLYTHPDVLDVQVIGIPDDTYGEEVMAWIIPKEDAKVTEEEIIEFCKGKISRHKIPKYIKFTEEYPMTASGKVQKFKLRERALEA